MFGKLGLQLRHIMPANELWLKECYHICLYKLLILHQPKNRKRKYKRNIEFGKVEQYSNNLGSLLKVKRFTYLWPSKKKEYMMLTSSMLMSMEHDSWYPASTPCFSENLYMGNGIIWMSTKQISTPFSLPAFLVMQLQTYGV